MNAQFAHALPDRCDIAKQAVRHAQDAGRDQRLGLLVLELALPLPESLGLLDRDHEGRCNSKITNLQEIGHKIEGALSPVLAESG